MTNGPVDLEAHRTIAAQRSEILRRKQLKEIQIDLRRMKSQQEFLEKRLLTAIEDSEKRFTGAGQVSISNGAQSVFGGATDRPTNGNAANVNWLHGTAPVETAVAKSDLRHSGADHEHLHGEELLSLNARSRRKHQGVATAIVYCEANFGKIDGKTANGLVRHSETYRIVAIIDSAHTGEDAGAVLDNTPNGIPICRDLGDAIANIDGMPDCFIFGMAPTSGMLSKSERRIMLDAIGLGMDIVNGLHEFLSEDDEFIQASSANNVKILDVRKPQSKTSLRLFTGRISEVTCPRIAVLGTDCAIGKRTTASILNKALNERGVKSVMVSTGQTGLIQGGRYGVALDAIPSQFCSGELEAAVLTAFEVEKPDVIIIEGQGALSHPAFSTSAFILRGSQPTGVILQHAPARSHRCDFANMPMPDPTDEINLIQCFAETSVIGLTINHENMSQAEVTEACVRYKSELGIATTDPLSHSPECLVEMIVRAYPQLQVKLNAAPQ